MAPAQLRAGSKGPRLNGWAVTRTNCPEPETDARWLLVRRGVSDPAEVAYFACGGPPGTTLGELVRVAGIRWCIEHDHRGVEQCTGIERCQCARRRRSATTSG